MKRIGWSSSVTSTRYSSPRPLSEWSSIDLIVENLRGPVQLICHCEQPPDLHEVDGLLRQATTTYRVLTKRKRIIGHQPITARCSMSCYC